MVSIFNVLSLSHLGCNEHYSDHYPSNLVSQYSISSVNLSSAMGFKQICPFKPFSCWRQNIYMRKFLLGKWDMLKNLACYSQEINGNVMGR